MCSVNPAIKASESTVQLRKETFGAGRKTGSEELRGKLSARPLLTCPEDGS